MQALVLIITGCIILYNLTINLQNLSNIANHCLSVNSTDVFWDAYWEGCAHGKAIFSSIIALVIAIPLYLIIGIIIVFRGKQGEKFTKGIQASRLTFQYDAHMPKGGSQFFYTNAGILGFDAPQIDITGITRFDFAIVISQIEENVKKQKKHFRIEAMQDIKLGKKLTTIPVLMKVNEEDYPLYLIYTEEQKQQFALVCEAFAEQGINDVIYFSAITIDQYDVAGFKPQFT